MKDIVYLSAVKKDRETIEQLLKLCELPHKNISGLLPYFFLAKQDDTIIGAICLRPLGSLGLIRSLAVKEEFRKKGIARSLFIKILGLAHKRKIKTLFLLTTTAERFFSALGFEKVERKYVPADIKKTEEYSVICPSSSVCMRKDIENIARYYPKEVLRPMPSGEGKYMWGVSLDNTMLTYFEIAPNSRFPIHSHDSEQITMIISGRLFFKVDDRVLSVTDGEVIALPAGISHSAYTEDEPVKAVDAWSPVMEKYNSG